jgi:hypothetical protein
VALRPLTFVALSQPRLALGTVATARTGCESIGSVVRAQPAARDAPCRVIVAPVAFHC